MSARLSYKPTNPFFIGMVSSLVLHVSNLWSMIYTHIDNLHTSTYCIHLHVHLSTLHLSTLCTYRHYTLCQYIWAHSPVYHEIPVGALLKPLQMKGWVLSMLDPRISSSAIL